MNEYKKNKRFEEVSKRILEDTLDAMYSYPDFDSIIKDKRYRISIFIESIETWNKSHTYGSIRIYSDSVYERNTESFEKYYVDINVLAHVEFDSNESGSGFLITKANFYPRRYEFLDMRAWTSTELGNRHFENLLQDKEYIVPHQ